MKRQIFDDAPGQTFYMTWDCVLYKLWSEAKTGQFSFWQLCELSEELPSDWNKNRTKVCLLDWDEQREAIIITH